MKIDPKVCHYHGRDIVVVTLDDGERQAFYRSTGKNSGMAGQWLPLDGIQTLPFSWFDKERFCRAPKGHPLHRFGSERLKAASEALGKTDIRPGQACGPQTINQWINTPASLAMQASNRKLRAEGDRE